MNIKGLTYIPKPLEGIASRTAPRSREQVLSELASLQRQEGRLEKKLILWTNNQKQAERDLRRVQKRRAFLERVLDQSGSAQRATSADNRAGNDDRREAATTREILPPAPEPQPEAELEPSRREPPIALERQRLGRRTTRR